MAVEGVLVALDVGTSKVCALIGEIGRDGRLTVIGHGTVPSSGLKRGAVVNIEQTVRSIRDAVERAERLSGWKIDKAFVGVGGAQITSFNSKGQVSVAAHTKEVGRDDIRRAVEQARTVPIASDREVLHVERRGFTVDGQEGVKDPLGMSAIRLEVETHIVGPRPRPEPHEVRRPPGVKIDGVSSTPSPPPIGRERTERELGVAVADSARHDDIACSKGSLSGRASCPSAGTASTNDITIWDQRNLAPRVPRASRSPLHVRTSRGTRMTRRSPSRSWGVEASGRIGGRLELCRIIESRRVRETFELIGAELPAGGAGMLPGADP